MVKYILKRLLLAILILFGVSVIIYFLIRMMPLNYISGSLAEVQAAAQTSRSPVIRLFNALGSVVTVISKPREFNLSAALVNIRYAGCSVDSPAMVNVSFTVLPIDELAIPIMKAIDTSIAVNDFYGSRLAEVIYRPMSKTSWAYPEGATEYSAISYDSSSDGDEIKALMEQAGYVRNGTGLYKSNRPFRSRLS